MVIIDLPLFANIVIPFASTFFGVFLAFLLGVWWQRRQRTMEESKLRLETKASIAEELKGIHKEILYTFEVWKENQNVIPHIDLATDAKDSSVTSGRFTLLELDLQTEISHIYAVIARAMDYRTRLLPPRLAMNPDPYPPIRESFTERLHHLEERVPLLLESLEAKAQ